MELLHTIQSGGRLSAVLRQELGLSAGLINRLKWQGEILLNGRPVRTDYPSRAGDVLALRLEEPRPNYPAEDGPLSIRYEDGALLAVDKPSGMLIHPSRAKNTGTLANFVLGYYHACGQDCAFHPVTRLDRDTFGLVLLAKDSDMHARMNRLHQQGLLRKTYHALVYGEPPGEAGVVDAPIARREMPSLLREIRWDGSPARTEYRVLRRLEGCCLLELTPVTGRTHQLRLHCAYLGCPILGDPQYGTPESQAFSAPLGLTTQALGAVALAFPHPRTGTEITLRSGLDVTLPRL